MNLVDYPDRELMMIALADQIASQLRRALERAERVTLCVPGGTTPAPVFELLSELELDWGRVNVLLNDERWVDETSPRSNTALLRRHLLKGRAAAATLVPLYLPAPRPEDRMAEISEAVQEVLPLTVVLLGMGEDMHTASLFPGADRLEEALANDAPPVLAMRAAAAGEPRITLSAPVLREAMHCHLLITGAQKRTALERAGTLPEIEAPVRTVLSHATIHWAP
ncbi:6-phosphogluconolactonase [Rhodobacter lacus]|uniref:6-phosphogluconolactonase n=1 Tax=Rhodobacter lacus TaxID=1641972 RepID=A0ABW5A7A4_9RHOB